VIDHPTPGREERNADRLLEADVVIRCTNLPALAWKIDRLLGDPARLTAMRANATSLAATLTGLPSLRRREGEA
jgi:processive 1,2-diacylglycerol beta-glucosyltransferase